MFASVYKTTLKNLFRSLIFWLMVAILIGFSLYEAFSGGHGYYSFEYKEMIWDTDSRYILSEENYIERIDNYCAAIMLYAMPLFAIVSAILILTRDYSDGFYEIERAGNQSPLCYLAGRLAALLTINLIIDFLIIFLGIHLYVLTRGGVADMATGEYLADSFVRILRTVVCTTWPPIAMFVCFAYAVGTLFKNGWAAAITSSTYVLINYLFTYQLRSRVPEWYGQYLSPHALKIRLYFKYYDYGDAERFEQYLIKQGTSAGLMLACVGLILGMILIYILVSYLRLRRREV